MKNNFDEAIRLLKRAETADSFIEKLYPYLGLAYHKKGDKQSACEYLAKAMEQKEISGDEFKEKCN
jgi:lipopolysaccharide biosynthesis regulator YciM